MSFSAQYENLGMLTQTEPGEPIKVEEELQT